MSCSIPEGDLKKSYLPIEFLAPLNMTAVMAPIRPADAVA